MPLAIGTKLGAYETQTALGAQRGQDVIGQTLGSYEVIAKLGEGGMGEVYRARDRKLGRDVALKILPAVFAADLERRARLEGGAQVLAVHPDGHPLVVR